MQHTVGTAPHDRCGSALIRWGTRHLALWRGAIDSLAARCLSCGGDRREHGGEHRSRVWRVTSPGRDIVVRRVADDVASWLHPILSTIAPRFPVPEPLKLFGDSSFIVLESGAWEALSWLPGTEIGFTPCPPLQDVGAFLAAFHNVALEATADADPRKRGVPLLRLDHCVDWQGAHCTMGSPDGVDRLRRLLDRLVADLDAVGYDQLKTCVVHGDPTTFNILAVGQPLRPAGLVDFELADIEAPVADIAFCLWRSGRPAQAAKELDALRVRDLLGGYCSVRPLDDAQLAAIPVCLRGRGLQMLAKRTQLGIADDGPVHQLAWLETHERQLTDAIAAGARSPRC